MGRTQRYFNEFDFIDQFYQEMIARGQSHKLTQLSIDTAMVDSICGKTSFSITEDELCKLADICFANGWINQTLMGDRYGNLQLTTTGAGVVKSKRKQKELLNNRGILKKASDFIVEHRGLFILFGASIGLISLLIKLFGGS